MKRFTPRIIRVWAALERHEVRRDMKSLRLQAVLPEETGVVHAFGAVGTTNHEPEFFGGEGPYAICGQHVTVRLAMSFPGEDDDACPRCAELVAQGVTVAPRRPAPLDCQSIVVPDLPGHPAAVPCARREDHDPPHRSESGATWVSGADDFTPGRYRG